LTIKDFMARLSAWSKFAGNYGHSEMNGF